MNLFHSIQVDDSTKIINELSSHLNRNKLKDILHSKSGDSLLHQAARSGKADILITLHNDFGLNLEQQNYDGKRPLHEASQHGCFDCVKYLISQKVVIDCLKRADWTPFMLACTKSNIDIIKELLKAGADPNLKNKDGWNSFHIACREGHVDIIELLLCRNDVLWNNVSKNGRTPLHTVGDSLLHQAARSGKVDILITLHNDFGLNLEQQNYDGKRPLHEASQHGCFDCVKYLISQKVVIDCLKRADWTPFMLACTKSNIDIIKELLKAGADPNLKNKDGWNSFHIACREGHVDIIELLLCRNDVLWNNVSKNGRTPLHTVALNGKDDALKLLLAKCQYERDVHDSCGSTPLMDAVRGGHMTCSTTLIDSHGASITQCDEMGRQCIHLAAQAGQLAMLERLITENGADVNVRSPVSGVTPLHVACKEGKHSVVEALIRHSADVNVVDFKSRTPLHMASGCQFAKCVNVLLCNGAKDCTDERGVYAKDLANQVDVKNLFLSFVS